MTATVETLAGPMQQLVAAQVAARQLQAVKDEAVSLVTTARVSVAIVALVTALAQSMVTEGMGAVAEAVVAGVAKAHHSPRCDTTQWLLRC